MKAPHQQKRSDQPRGLRRPLQILIVIGLLLVASLVVLVIRPPASSQAVGSGPTPYVTFTPGPGGRIAPGGIPVTPRVPPPTLAATGKKPPACTFPLAQTTTADSAPETYTFSDMKPVPYNSSWSDIRPFQWLPDNQRVLVGHSDEAQMNDLKQTIGLLNPQTGESQDFGSRYQPGTARPPVWIPSLKAVVYPESLDLTPPTYSNNGQGPVIPVDSADFQRRLWFSRGDPAHLQKLVDERVTVTYDRASQFGEEITVVASPDGSEIVYLDTVGRQLYAQKVVQGAFQSVPSPAFDATQWVYRPDMLTGWYMTWRPNSAQVFLYSQGYGIGPSYTFLLDTQSGQVCELNLWTDDPTDPRKSWVTQAHWSPNGRDLAVVRTKGQPVLDFSDLIVLDTATGKLYQIEPAQLSPAGVEKLGKRFITDVAWAPDNRHLAAFGKVVDSCMVSCVELQSADRLFLVDFLTGQAVQVSSAELRPSVGWPNEYLLWSNDGSQLIVLAPRGLYLFSVQKRVQP